MSQVYGAIYLVTIIAVVVTMIFVSTFLIQIQVKLRLHPMWGSNSASDGKETILIFDLKVHILFIGYDVTIKYGLHLELSSWKNGPRNAIDWTQDLLI